MSVAGAERPPHQFPEGVNPNDKDRISTQFRSSLILIQSRPLNPDTIDTYAEDALSDLVDLSASITDAYRASSPTFSGLGRDLEDQAFEHFGLKSINGILSYVAAKDAEIKQIGSIVERAENTGQVIVPPDKIDPPVGDGNGEFKKKSVISRTKTVLFILANDFGVDLNNPDDFSIKTGVLTDTMMRGLSYYQISVPSLGRTILCCDEEGNVSYVFDNKVLEEHGITPDDLATLTKNDINDLLESDVKIGKRVSYSAKFVSRMIGFMTDLRAENIATEPQGMYLIPVAPEGVISAKKFASKIGITRESVLQAIKEMGADLGEVQSYRFSGKITTGLNLEQQNKIIEFVGQQGRLDPKAPDGIESISTLATELHIRHSFLKNVIENMPELGALKEYRFGNARSVGLNPEQVIQIKRKIEEMGILISVTPDEILSIASLAKQLNVSHLTVANAVRDLGGGLGELENYKFGSVTSVGLSRQQQDLVRQRLTDKGILSAQASEDVLSVGGLAAKYKISVETISRAIMELGEEVGEVKIYRFRSNYAGGFNSGQQMILERYLQEKNLLVSRAPEGVVTATSLARELGVDTQTVKKVIKKISNSLGEVKFFKFKSRITQGYTPEQKALIVQDLRERGLIAAAA